MTDVRAFRCAQGSREWHELRAKRYGASETPQIGGLTGRQARVWRAKLGQPEELAALYLELGHLLEPWALQKWSAVMRRPVKPGPVLAELDGWLLASLDGISGGEPVEAKVVTRGAPDFDAWTAETVPAAKELQVRQQAALAEVYLGRRLEAAHITAIILDGYGVEHRTYRIALTAERRESWSDLWAPYPARWHAEYVATRRPPPDAEAADVAVLVEPTSVRRREATPEEATLVARLAEAEAARKTAAAVASAAVKERDAVRDTLARSVGPAATVPGVQWKTRRGLPPLFTLE